MSNIYLSTHPFIHPLSIFKDAYYNTSDSYFYISFKRIELGIIYIKNVN